MLAKYSIRTKIIAVVAFLLVAMTGMGLLAVKNMRAINANTVDITTNWLPSVRVLGDLRAGVITYRNVIREHMLCETLEEKLAMEKTLATVIETNTKIRAAYEPMITSPEERALYNEWVEAVGQATRRAPRRSWRCPARRSAKLPHEAHELNTKTVNKIGLEADAVLKKDIDLNNAGADKAAQDAADSYASRLHDAGRDPRRGRHHRHRRQLLSGSRRLERHRLHRHADAGAGQRRPERGGAASGREDRNRRHGGYPAGVQAGADRQEGRRRGRGGRMPKPRSSAAAASTASPAISNP